MHEAGKPAILKGLWLSRSRQLQLLYAGWFRQPTELIFWRTRLHVADG